MFVYNVFLFIFVYVMRESSHTGRSRFPREGGAAQRGGGSLRGAAHSPRRALVPSRPGPFRSRPARKALFVPAQRCVFSLLIPGQGVLSNKDITYLCLNNFSACPRNRLSVSGFEGVVNVNKTTFKIIKTTTTISSKAELDDNYNKKSEKDDNYNKRRQLQ